MPASVSQRIALSNRAFGRIDQRPSWGMTRREIALDLLVAGTSQTKTNAMNASVAVPPRGGQIIGGRYRLRPDLFDERCADRCGFLFDFPFLLCDFFQLPPTFFGFL